ncbi:hypothetical protein SISNIDRAFT_487990 [Sistotremastrum niveocremeum HHB9708]|uniref:Uncharacterized protein n=1 Tax=Sistotremastrum niveocremeum HHB9708 TaxID=1314777 RepID=A0A164RXN2_9AGAM|nr:hypothetical protein SISNIDRAFT_487990 [Sistotremastrum niveocremeum HHB9708]
MAAGTQLKQKQKSERPPSPEFWAESEDEDELRLIADKVDELATFVEGLQIRQDAKKPMTFAPNSVITQSPPMTPSSASSVRLSDQDRRPYKSPPRSEINACPFNTPISTSLSLPDTAELLGSPSRPSSSRGSTPARNVMSPPPRAFPSRVLPSGRHSYPPVISSGVITHYYPGRRIRDVNKPRRWYVVLKGREPGIFDDW